MTAGSEPAECSSVPVAVGATLPGSGLPLAAATAVADLQT
jgi:hypothetical protein